MGRRRWVTRGSQELRSRTWRRTERGLREGGVHGDSRLTSGLSEWPVWKSPRRGVRGDPTLRWRELPSARASEPSGLSGGGLHLRAGGQGAMDTEPQGQMSWPGGYKRADREDEEAQTAGQADSTREQVGRAQGEGAGRQRQGGTWLPHLPDFCRAVTAFLPDPLESSPPSS